MSGRPYSVSFHTLGCKVNQYETQSMSEHFAEAGYYVVADGLPADVYIINTCSVTNVADRKSRQFIRRARKLNPEAVVAVTGCYAQTAPEEVVELEGVNIVAGNNEKSRLVDYVTRYIEENVSQPLGERRVDAHILSYEQLTEYEDLGCITAMESRSRAFIKIQDGCNRFCSYCIIPYARGQVRSRGVDSILQEAQSLLDAGYRELVLTGINTALFGAESDGRRDIVDLIDAMEQLPGDFRIRLSSLEPNVIDEAVARRLLAHPRVCHHMHLALQSGCDAVLRRMNRRYTVEQFRRIADVLRSGDPEYGITTDIITGFPGETEAEFQTTLETVRSIGFSKVHVFRYSPRGGTRAAAMPEQIDGTEKGRRAAILTEEADLVQRAFFRRNQGQIRRVLFETLDEASGLLEGYTDNYIKVYAEPAAEGEIPAGFVDVKLQEPALDGMRGRIEPASAAGAGER